MHDEIFIGGRAFNLARDLRNSALLFLQLTKRSLVRVLGPVDRRNRVFQLAPTRLGRVPHYLELRVRRLRPARVGEQPHRIDAVSHPLERVGAGEQVAWVRRRR